MSIQEANKLSPEKEKTQDQPHCAAGFVLFGCTQQLGEKPECFQKEW